MLWRRVRAYAQWPQAYTWWRGKRLRILSAEYRAEASAPPGVVVAEGSSSRPKVAAIGTGAGTLLPRTLGLEGKRATTIQYFLQGYPGFVGADLRAAAAN
jgi:methionyl-tRNA formyltransferase